MIAQIWILKRRYNDFDKMHRRLINDLEYRAADNLPELPPKRLFFNKEVDFIKDRLRFLNKYLKFMILIYEAIENPILQRFLEIDTNFNPNYEFDSIDVEKNSARRSSGDCSSLFLEMDKYMKTRFRHVLSNKVGPVSPDRDQNATTLLARMEENQEQIKLEEENYRAYQQMVVEQINLAERNE